MTPEQRSDVELLLAAGATNAEAARATGVSDKRVSEIRAKMEGTTSAEATDATKDREAYAKGLRRRIPVSRRVNILATLVGSKNPQVAIKALEMADRLSGYAKDDALAPPATNPIFTLPVGTKVRFGK